MSYPKKKPQELFQCMQGFYVIQSQSQKILIKTILYNTKQFKFTSIHILEKNFSLKVRIVLIDKWCYQLVKNKPK